MPRCIAALLVPALLLAALGDARQLDSREGVKGLASAALPRMQHYASRHLLGDCFPCSNNCAVCSEQRTLRNAQGNPTGFKEITIDASSCKNGDLSWMCCRGASDGAANLACTLTPGGCSADGTPVYDFGKNKCDSKVQMGTFEVPNAATQLTVQIHDGRAAGNVSCSTAGRCCGGSPSSCGTGTGVCEWVIDLSTCPDEEGPVGQPQCGEDAPCPQPAGACEVAECIAGECVTSFRPSTYVCGTAEGDCDVPANCTGDSPTCPPNSFKPSTVQCRDAAGDCDLPAKCTGDSAACPANPFKPSTEQCRGASDVCDLPAKCTGSSAACPANPFKPSTEQCRGASDVCDLPAKCTGSSAACPANPFMPSTVTCRPAAGICDKEEKCTGSAAACPADAKMPSTTVCRAAKDLCDKAEYCTGTTNACPTDIVLRDKAKAFKCGRDCFYCGMPLGTTAATLGNELTYLKNTWSLGTCNMGSCDFHYFLTSASDVATYCGNTLPTTCPNKKDLSNVSHARCNGATGTWNCVVKQDAPFSGPVVAPWAGL